MLGKTQKYKSSGEKTSSKRQADWNTGKKTSFNGQSDYDIGIRFCYELLGISNSATKEEVLSAYRQKSKKYHPDVGGNKGDNNIFSTLTDAKNKILKHMG
jgi:DnaJ-class molecular chaperone